MTSFVSLGVMQRVSRSLGRLLLVVGLMSNLVGQAATLYSPNSNSVPLSPELTNAPLRRLDDGSFEIGQVRFDKIRKTITLPAVVNMREGILEYLLVSSVGKLHESLLRTEAEPYHIHLASLFLSAAAPADQIPRVANPTNELSGDTVTISISWNSANASTTLPAEDLIYNAQSKSSMTRGNWIYNGSRLIQRTFLAQRDGSVISLITDPDALMNNPRPGRDNDDIWQANSAKVPPLGTPAQVTIQFAGKPAKA